MLSCLPNLRKRCLLTKNDVGRQQRHATILAWQVLTAMVSDKDKLLCDLCHKPVKAPGGKSRPNITYLLNIDIAIFCKYRIDIVSKLKK